MKSKLKISAEQQGNKAVIRIDGYISEWSNSAQVFKFQLDTLINAGIRDAEVYIKSEGGDVIEASEIANEIKRFPGTITAHLGSLCASAATYIACNCSKVIAASNTSYMIHKPMAFLSGNYDEIEARLKGLKNVQEDYSRIYCNKTGMTPAKLEDMWKEEFWMNAQEAKNLGFVDEIEGEADITENDITALGAVGYKCVPKITASAKSTQTNNDNIMKDILITALALVATASEAQIIAAVDGLKAKAAKADSLQKELDEVKATALTAGIKALLDTAEANKQTTPAERAYYEKRLRENFDETKSHIEAKPKVSALSNTIPASGAGAPSAVDRSGWKYTDYMEKDPQALSELAKTDEAKFNALFEAHYGKIA